MLFVVKKGTIILIAKSINDSFTNENLKKMKLSQAFAVKESLLAIDPFALNSRAITKDTSSDTDLDLLIHKGYYGFRNTKDDRIFLVNCKDIKIFE